MIDYQNIELCVEKIKPSGNCEKIQLSINFMGIEPESSCGYDYFQIAWPNVSTDLMENTGKFCGYINAYNSDYASDYYDYGNEFPVDGLTINSSEFEFRWQTDYSVIDEGVELEWTCEGKHNQKVPKVDPCDLRIAFKFYKIFKF